MLSNIREFWRSFPSAGFSVALTRVVKEDQLILLCPEFTLSCLKRYAPKVETMEEYDRLWGHFEKTTWKLDPESVVPHRLDGLPRRRCNKQNPLTCCLRQSCEPPRYDRFFKVSDRTVYAWTTCEKIGSVEAYVLVYDEAVS